MWASGLGRTYSPIGVDIGRHSVKLAQLDRPGPQGRVIAAASAPLPTGLSFKDENYGQWVSAAIRQALEQGRFFGRRCVSCPPASAMHIKSIRLPKMPIAEMREAVAFEAKDRLATRDPLTVQFLQAGEVRQGDDLREEVILLAISTPMVEQHVKCLLESGLRPMAVDATPCAMARLYAAEPINPDDAGNHEVVPLLPAQMVVDLGYDASKVLIVRGGQVMFYKLIQIGGQQFDKEISQHLHIDPAEANDLRRRLNQPDEAAAGTNVQRAVHDALRTPMHELAREIGLCLRYFGVTFRGDRPHTLELTGGESGNPILRHLLGEQLGLPVVPMTSIETDIDWPDRAERFALATGLAMRIEAGWGERRRLRRAAA